jgi:hypothetical protein
MSWAAIFANTCKGREINIERVCNYRYSLRVIAEPSADESVNCVQFRTACFPSHISGAELLPRYQISGSYMMTSISFASQKMGWRYEGGTAGWRKLHADEFCNLHSPPRIIRAVKSGGYNGRRMKSSRRGMKNAHVCCKIFHAPFMVRPHCLLAWCRLQP